MSRDGAGPRGLACATRASEARRPFAHLRIAEWCGHEAKKCCASIAEWHGHEAKISTEDHHPVRVTAERGDVVLHPLHGCALVLDAEVACNTKGYSSTYLAMGFATVRAGTGSHSEISTRGRAVGRRVHNIAICGLRAHGNRRRDRFVAISARKRRAEGAWHRWSGLRLRTRSPFHLHWTQTVLTRRDVQAAFSQTSLSVVSSHEPSRPDRAHYHMLVHRAACPCESEHAMSEKSNCAVGVWASELMSDALRVPAPTTRILGRRTAPFSPIPIPTRPPHGVTPRS